MLMVRCMSSFTWGRDGTRMYYRKKASWRRQCDVTWTCTIYLNIVADQVHPLMATIQQDNAPCYTANIVQEWFEAHNKKFKVLPCPPNSPDVYPIEHLWDVLEKQL